MIGNDHLRQIIERIEHLSEEKNSIADDIRDVYAEAKSSGFDVKALRAVIKRRRADMTELEEHENIVDTYLVALGMTPLEAAISRVGAENISVKQAS